MSPLSAFPEKSRISSFFYHFSFFDTCISSLPPRLIITSVRREILFISNVERISLLGMQRYRSTKKNDLRLCHRVARGFINCALKELEVRLQTFYITCIIRNILKLHLHWYRIQHHVHVARAWNKSKNIVESKNHVVRHSLDIFI